MHSRMSSLSLAAACVVGLALYFCGVALRANTTGSFLIAGFDFDDGVGGPDAQGWSPAPWLGQTSAYFHVDDFSGAGHEFTPLEGNQSLWCGLAADDPRACYWVHAPGYGNYWGQDFESIGFAVTGDVTISYKAHVDTEPGGYDAAALQYSDGSGGWVTLATHEGFEVQSFESHTVPAAAHSGSLAFRFRFFSDGGLSDEDGLLGFEFHGGFVLDSLTVSDQIGVIDFQDFEAELPGDTVTTDGDWTAHAGAFWPEFSALVDGDSVFQDVVSPDTTYVWSFFTGSPHDFGCAGHPEQEVIPEGITGGLSAGLGACLHNTVRSPLIDLREDVDGVPLGGGIDSLVIEIDTYHHQGSGFINRIVSLRYVVDGCLRYWESLPAAQVQQSTGWQTEHVALLAPTGATHIQLSLGVQVSCATLGCQSHAPLYDNVSVTRYGGAPSGIPAVMVRPPYAIEQNHPNPFNPSTTIRYTLASPGQVTIDVFDVTGRRVRTLVDGVRPLGANAVSWDGRDDRGRQVSSGVYFYRMRAADFMQTRKMVLLK